MHSGDNDVVAVVQADGRLPGLVGPATGDMRCAPSKGKKQTTGQSVGERTNTHQKRKRERDRCRPMASAAAAAAAAVDGHRLMDLKMKIAR